MVMRRKYPMYNFPQDEPESTQMLSYSRCVICNLCFCLCHFSILACVIFIYCVCMCGVGPRDRIQVMKLGSKQLYSVSHPISPNWYSYLPSWLDIN